VWSGLEHPGIEFSVSRSAVGAYHGVCRHGNPETPDSVASGPGGAIAGGPSLSDRRSVGVEVGDDGGIPLRFALKPEIQHPWTN
jgi:hypothetical protein